MRAVTTTEFMTADWYRMPHEVLDRLWRAALAPAGRAGVLVCAAAGFFAYALFLSGRDPAGLPACYANVARLLDDVPAAD